MLWYRRFKALEKRVRYFADGAGDSASGGGSGDNSGGSGAGQAEAGQGEAGKAATVATDWRAGLDASIKDHPCLKDFKDPLDVAKSYVNVQKLIGVDKLPIPPADAKPEVRDQFLNIVFDRIGRPKEAKDYKITEIKLPDGVSAKTDPAFVEELKTTAHKLGLLPNQVDGLYSWYMNKAGSKAKEIEDSTVKARQDAEAALRSEFGAAYDGKVKKAQELLNKFAGDDYKALLDKGLGNDPAVIRFMAKMAEAISEDTFQKGSGEATMTPAEAQKELATIREQLVKMDKSNPEYRELLKRRNTVMEMANPS